MQWPKEGQKDISTCKNKRQRKPKGKSRMENLETLATLGTQDTGRRQIKHKNTTQKTKKWSNTCGPQKQPVVNPCAREG